MIFKGISNDVVTDATITPWAYIDNIFSDEELKKMNYYFSRFSLEKSGIYDGQGEPKLDNHRISNTRFFKPEEENAWIFEKLNKTIDFFNLTAFHYELTGYDYLQYTEYDSKENGKYDFHMDLFLGRNIPEGEFLPRKLSLSLILNEPNVDFEGGKLEINSSTESDAEEIEQKKGRIIIFPSFMIHRITPVTKGVRKTIVLWVLGQKFK